MAQIWKGIKLPNAITYMWSGRYPVPGIGDDVNVTMNGLGPGKVIEYFITEGESDNYWLGVLVELKEPPAWYIRQNEFRRNYPARVYGREIEPAEMR